jgi:hypothetical protein
MIIIDISKGAMVYNVDYQFPNDLQLVVNMNLIMATGGRVLH